MTDVDQRSNGTNHHPHHPMVHHVPSIDHHVVQPRHRRRSQGHHGENNSGGRYRGMFSMSNDSEVSVEPLQGASMDVHIRVHNSEQFWNEVEAILIVPEDCTLTHLDNTLRMFVTFCAAYHDNYLNAAHEMYHAVDMLLGSELYTYHSERMVGIMMSDAQENTNPHELYILYHIVLYYGQRHPSLFRSHRKWRKLLPTLGEVVGLEVEETFVLGLPPIESRLRLPATDLMYEVCRVQKLSTGELSQFDDRFIDHLFELVETTRDHQDETLNYAVIRLIVALNEQFMVSTLPIKNEKLPSSTLTPGTATLMTDEPESLPLPDSSEAPGDATTSPAKPKHLSALGHVRNHFRVRSGSAVLSHERPHAEDAKKLNRVLIVLMRRLGSSKTFGENVIFMLNRAGESSTGVGRDETLMTLTESTPEGLCMQLLILKILYLLFTTPGTQEYFYTNDLRVLLDVFIRELVDLPEECEALRHTYLRVLYPLLNHTQLRTDPYKRPQIKLVLRSFISQAHIKEVGPTTIRLVERCLEEPKKFERSLSAENLRQDSTCSTISLDSVSRALPHHSRLQPTSIYTSRDPVRQSSLMDVSESLTAQRETRPRSTSSATSIGGRSDTSDTTAGKPRRKAPAPPIKKSSQASSTSLSSLDERGTPKMVPGVFISDENGHRSDDESGRNAYGKSRSGTPHRDLVEVGGKRIPAPIIEGQPAVEGWITFGEH